jgi:LysM repeat protein
MIALYTVWYNFVKMHKTLKMTPALAANVTDTLWSIAARSGAGDVREAVWKLEQRNHLSSAAIRPGQKLVLPSSY